MKIVFIAIVMMVSLNSFAQKGKNGLHRYSDTKRHHRSADDVWSDISKVGKEKFCADHAIGWNVTLDSLAEFLGGDFVEDGVQFTFEGENFVLPYINGNDYEAILNSSTIKSFDIEGFVTSAWINKDPGYVYYYRYIDGLDGEQEKFFCTSLGSFYKEPKLNKIIVAHTADLCLNPNKLVFIQGGVVSKKKRHGKEYTKVARTDAGGDIYLSVDNSNTNHNENNSSSNQNQKQASSGGGGGFIPPVGNLGGGCGGTVGTYGYGAPWLSAGISASYYDNGCYNTPIPQRGGGCNNDWQVGRSGYGSGWGSSPRPRSDRGSVNPGISRRPIINGGGLTPRGHNNGQGGQLAPRNFNPGNQGGGMNGRGFNRGGQ